MNKKEKADKKRYEVIKTTLSDFKQLSLGDNKTNKIVAHFVEQGEETLLLAEKNSRYFEFNGEVNKKYEKYRLKQWYPSLGSDFEVKDIVYFDRIRGCYASTNNRDIVLRKREVENNPDFWELIEEKKPLFTTEDDVGIFVGDSFIIVEEDFKKHRLIAHNLPYTEDFKRFKHESNADEYILRNKKVFSYEDFMRWGNVPYERAIKKLAIERSKGNE